MLRTAALPFVLRRSHGVVGTREITSTVEKLFGLLRIDGDRLVVQWRTAREISRVGPEIRVDRELASLQEVSLPLAGLSGARLQRKWRRWFLRECLVLNAADLQVFDALVGDEGVAGLVLEHPAELVLDLRTEDRELARNFVSELRLAISEQLLQASEAALDAMEQEEAAALPDARPAEDLPASPDASRTRVRG